MIDVLRVDVVLVLSKRVDTRLLRTENGLDHDLSFLWKRKSWLQNYDRIQMD